MDYKNCPNCPNQGWYVHPNNYTGEPEQVQCEFCECEPNSVFNVINRLEAENAKLKQNINKVKADAIREATASLNQNINTNGTEFDMCYSSELEDYADSIECNCQ